MPTCHVAHDRVALPACRSARSLEDAATAVEHATGLPAGKCRMAVAVAGSPARAVEFLKSGDRQAARRAMVRAVDLLAHADEADILAAARDLMVRSRRRSPRLNRPSRRSWSKIRTISPVVL
ncbi:MAG: hypothetical protein ACLTSX_09595 [Collinsella sp.]